MYIPRGKLLALVTIVVAASLVTATGAFSSVQAERTAEVNVAGDADAYLGLAAHEGDNGHFAEEDDSTGKLNIKFNEDMETDKIGKGVNPESITSFDNVFTITNQGTQDVTVEVESDNDVITLYDSGTGDNLDETEKEIGSGDSIDVGIKIDASDKTAGFETTEDFTITAETGDAADVDTTLPENGGDSSGDSDESEE